jgi:hypothetical protein
MRRTVFDVLTSAVGLVLVVVLLVAGGLLMWGYSYDHNNVHNQLAEQQIFFPPKSVWATAKAGTEITPAMIPYLEKYSGQQLLTGPQAEAYADHFIAIHLSELPYGGVYSKISTAARAQPTNTKLAALETTSFQGTTLRGAAARGLRLLEDRHDHALWLDRLLHPRPGHARVRGAWLPPRTAHPDRAGAAGSQAQPGPRGDTILTASFTVAIPSTRH